TVNNTFESIIGPVTSGLASLQEGSITSKFVPMETVVQETLKRIERAYDQYQCGSLVSGIPTGYRDLDDTLGGVHPGELFIIAGRPGMGKTALSAGIARGVAEGGYGVAFVTAE